jgi:hypothetical protein
MNATEELAANALQMIRVTRTAVEALEVIALIPDTAPLAAELAVDALRRIKGEIAEPASWPV